MSEVSQFSRRVDVGTVPAGGVERHIEASAEERAALAEEFGLLGVDSLAADVTIAPWQRDGFAITGRVTAAIRQSCVVSLVPVEQGIDEQFEVHFVPAGSRLAASKPVRDVVVQVSDEEPPETFSGHSIDVGSVVKEQFALAIDPYPRAPGAEMPAEFWESEPQADNGESPFAVLEKLKNQDGTKR